MNTKGHQWPDSDLRKAGRGAGGCRQKKKLIVGSGNLPDSLRYRIPARGQRGASYTTGRGRKSVFWLHLRAEQKLAGGCRSRARTQVRGMDAGEDAGGDARATNAGRDACATTAEVAR